MTRVQTIFIAGAVGVLALGGGVWTQAREINSNCGDPFFTQGVHEEMRTYFREESQYYKALLAGAESDRVAPENQAIYQQAANRIEEALEKTAVQGRMKHPNGPLEKTCYLSLAFDNVLADLDLSQRTFLGFPVDRRFEVIARFKIRFEDVTGEEFENRFANNRDNWLLIDLNAGEVAETVPLAKLTRRDFQLIEPGFIEIDFETAFIPEETIERGYFGD